MTRIVQRPAMAANKLIEEMMVMANVCAAETLEGKAVPLILRVHDVPSQEKRAALGDFLRSLNIKWAPGERISTARFNRLLDEAEAKGHGEAVNDMVLRSQAQAMYSTENIGHFGLNLSQYAHFTSPIRRYADLTVHRALLRVMKLSNEDAPEIDWLRDTAEHISTTERAAMAAERDAADGYLARFMADRVDERFTARISGVTRAGAFVRLEESGADGLVPMSLLGPERFRHVPARQALVGEQTGGTFRLGMGVEVRLVEATPVSGGLLFAMETRVKGRKGDARAANTPKGRVKRGRRRT